MSALSAVILEIAPVNQTVGEAYQSRSGFPSASRGIAALSLPFQTIDRSHVIHPMFDSARHRLLHALTLSLLIHAVLLLGVLSVLPLRLDVPAATINAVLHADASPAPVSAAAPSVKPAPARTRAADTPQANGRRLSVESPSLMATPPLAMKPAPTEAAVASSPVVDSRPVSPGAQSSAQSLPHEAVSADDLRQYRVSLAIAARRFKRYPALARERGWEGTAEVALAISAHLPEPQAVLLRSSGHAVLDQQAQEMMVQAARATALPERLKGRDLRIVLPVKFSLEADQ